ncbi:uncharacterized protein LOC124181410 [Neodiprion fabricii]|uniref:uncharacterized protein LOC124181410 n=1 Tax=Neodiprion fabricii TaxID=2872261 RepID=UPI001ED90DA8|nr:uncharacterized protein LOC124181410 [Neodiprion fabricii]
MKILQSATVIFVLLQILVTISALKNVCKYKRRQMTPGQSVSDCYTITTCNKGGVLSRKEACPRYICAHYLRGYKQFDHRKPYPECCGGPICDDVFKSYYYIP